MELLVGLLVGPLVVMWVVMVPVTLPVGMFFPTGEHNFLTINTTPVPVGISRHTGAGLLYRRFQQKSTTPTTIP